ncbi:MAG: hypothetical protein R3245_01400 [Kiloniellales bacterium]|nr:hypothetical protein [Kiloniellales bacterium]
MNQDLELGVTMTITQSDIPAFRGSGRLGEYAVVYRVYRQLSGGGYGDQTKHPYAWGVLVYIDGNVARVYSSRGLPREWTDLARLERWMREQGFWYWWVRNDLEPLYEASGDQDPESAEVAESVSSEAPPLDPHLAQMFKIPTD